MAEVERSIVKRFVKEEAPTLTIVASEAQMEGVEEKSDSGAPQLLDPLVRDLLIWVINPRNVFLYFES